MRYDRRLYDGLKNLTDDEIDNIRNAVLDLLRNKKEVVENSVMLLNKINFNINLNELEDILRTLDDDKMITVVADFESNEESGIFDIRLSIGNS